MTKSHVGQVIAYLIKSVRKSHDSGIATLNSPMHSPLGVQAFGLGTGQPVHSPIQHGPLTKQTNAIVHSPCAKE